jgi:hypothetical protein
LHARCSVAAAAGGAGSRGILADPGAGPGATLCAPLPAAAAGFTVLSLTPPTGGSSGARQGLTLVPISAQLELFCPPKTQLNS